MPEAQAAPAAQTNTPPPAAAATAATPAAAPPPAAAGTLATPAAQATPPATPAGTPAADPKATADPAAAAAPPKDPKETPGQAKVVPEKYDLKLPEGSLLDPKSLEKIASRSKEQGLSNEEAQKDLERESAAYADFDTRQKEQVKQVQSAWVDTARADPEIGGEAFTQNVELSKRVVSRFFTDGFRSALESTGLGNNPELLRGLTRIGKAMSEDQLVIPKAPAAAKKSTEEILYTHDKQ